MNATRMQNLDVAPKIQIFANDVIITFKHPIKLNALICRH